MKLIVNRPLIAAMALVLGGALVLEALVRMRMVGISHGGCREGAARCRRQSNSVGSSSFPWWSFCDSRGRFISVRRAMRRLSSTDGLGGDLTAALRVRRAGWARRAGVAWRDARQLK